MRSLQGILPQSLYRKVSPTEDCVKKRGRSGHSTVVKEGKMESRKKIIVQDVQS